MIVFSLNGELIEYSGNPSARLLDVLRGELKLTGTKCGCLEGECGACSVIIDGKLYNSCLAAMGSLHGAVITTIEGYSKTDRFNALSNAYASVSAVQCGYCIPGMILASECLLANAPEPTNEEIREGISGNLCRCTGYNAIVKAIGIAASSMNRTAPPTLKAGKTNTPGKTNNSNAVTSSKSLTEVLVLRKEKPHLIPCCGGTDLMVEEDCSDKDYLFLGNVTELKRIAEDDEYIRFGAACTFSEVVSHELTPAILKEMCLQIAAPAIRNAGTVGGNLGNGSAKADSALIFMVTDSKLRLCSSDSERIIPVKDFYLGGGKVALKSNELITEVLMPKHGLGNYYIKKVGARNSLAISRVSFAGIMNIEDGVIQNCATAFGAVIDTIIRFSHIDQMLIGKTIPEAKELAKEYFAAYDAAIVPRRGRVGVEYRKDVCMNLLRDFLEVSFHHPK